MGSNCAEIQRTFTGAEIPFNVAVARRFERHFFLRRLGRLALGSGLFGREAQFHYHSRGSDRLIRYNSRNLQYRAIYDPEYTHGYEIETGLLLRRLCAGPRAFWDVGANWGYFTLLVASFPEFAGEIVAFEPNPGTFSDLDRTIDQAGLKQCTTLRHQGVGSLPCEMVVDPGDGFNTGLSQLKLGGHGVRVPVVTLDSLEGQAPGVIKIDAEGMEADILRGGERTLESSKPAVIFESFLEADPRKTLDPLDFLRARNYRIFVPVLEFRIFDRPVRVTYGQCEQSWFEQDPEPSLALRELGNAERFLLGRQLNLLGVHKDSVDNLWTSGIVQINHRSVE